MTVFVKQSKRYNLPPITDPDSVDDIKVNAYLNELDELPPFIKQQASGDLMVSPRLASQVGQY